MKMLNVYYGTKAYDFDVDAYHYKTCSPAFEGDIDYSIEKAKMDFNNGGCFWYLIIVTEFNPHTGEASTTHIFDGVEEKQKIILNSIAKPDKKKPKKTPNYTIHDFLKMPLTAVEAPVDEDVWVVVDETNPA